MARYQQHLESRRANQIALLPANWTADPSLHATAVREMAHRLDPSDGGWVQWMAAKKAFIYELLDACAAVWRPPLFQGDLDNEAEEVERMDFIADTFSFLEVTL